MAEVMRTPDVEAYANLKIGERAQVRAVLALNQRLLAEQAETLADQIEAAKEVRARAVSNARSHARRDAKKEVDRIYADTFRAERVRLFEAHKGPYGDIEACAAEAADYDERISDGALE